MPLAINYLPKQKDKVITMGKPTPTYEDNPNLYYYPSGATEPVLKTPEMVQEEKAAADAEPEGDADDEDEDLPDEDDSEELDEETDSGTGAEVKKKEPAGKKGPVGARGRPRGTAKKK